LCDARSAHERRFHTLDLDAKAPTLIWKSRRPR
jgi:hypothetical protein